MRFRAVVPLLVVTAAGTWLLAPRASAQDDLVEEGRQLYVTGCSSCHGNDGGGIEIEDGSAGGPSLRDAGEAGAYFFLSTGRMPLSSTSEQPTRKDPEYSPQEIDALVAYVASLGDGPELPRIDLDDADLAEGGSIYRANCQACHNASGSGGALSYGDAAPKLSAATPEQIGAAVRVGPGQMPRFGDDTITDQELDDLTRYVEYLDHPDDPGGLPIGRTGPVPEGFVAWLVGMVAFVGLVYWIGTRNPIEKRAEKRADEPVEEPEEHG
jgi:ubiquinol-cytochrome c reductase cytochrome c subunit